MNSPKNSALEATTTLPPERWGGSEGSVHSYFLIIQNGSSRPEPLPSEGSFVIGRDEDAQLRFNENSVSRQHARISASATGISIEDLDSHNGTFVNGNLIVKPRSLSSGDIVTIGTIQLILHRGTSQSQGAFISDVQQLQQRLGEDIARALRFKHSLAILCFELGQAVAGAVDQTAVMARLAGKLRVIDSAGWYTPEQLVILLPDHDRDEASAKASELLALLEPLSSSLRGTYALCPADGCDRDMLLGSVSNTARQASIGELREVRQSVVEYQLAGKRVLLADPAMIRVFEAVRKLARDDIPVLITGESGCGKDLVAEALHRWSPRAQGPFIIQNCAAIADTLVEDALFGHERGAFTDAKEAQTGLFERADGGTLFLDEIGELTQAAQAKLLRIIEDKVVERLGSRRGPRQLDVRVIAATNRDLAEAVATGRFRKDLFYRVAASTVFLKPLRDRPGDIAHLARAFLETGCQERNRPVPRLSDAVYDRLHSYKWEGNVRQLQNVMTYLAVMIFEPVIEPWHLPPLHDADAQSAANSANYGDGLGAAPDPAGRSAAYARESTRSLDAGKMFQPIEYEKQALEKLRMQEALAASGGVITRAARLIEMPERTFHKRMKEYGIDSKGLA